jgi:hypothetical protein
MSHRTLKKLLPWSLFLAASLGVILTAVDWITG